ncbi:DUF4129 domain-containing protein [Streptomyces sp. NPDC006458]|uniref:DUF4129 domain-containing protein n=1 Tax=Streptomyces sp. NPDC006458 TaxID=3154302 RepID=UPI0033A0070A
MSLTGGVLTAAPGAVDTALRAALRAGHHTTLSSALTRARTGDTEPPLTVPRDPAREAARRELAKRMYHENEPNLLERALNSFWDWLGSVFDAADAVTPGGAVGLVVIALAVLAVLGALWWRLGSPRRGPVSAPALFDDRPRSAAEHRAAAEAHAAQGHFSQAVQERMRAIVRALEERALLDARPGRTADEAAADAGRALPAHTDRLRAAARDFDDVTYGGRTATEASYRRIAELDRDLERAKPRLTTSSTANTADNTRQGAAG